jgi:hypothetical protein
MGEPNWLRCDASLFAARAPRMPKTRRALEQFGRTQPAVWPGKHLSAGVCGLVRQIPQARDFGEIPERRKLQNQLCLRVRLQ